MDVDNVFAADGMTESDEIVETKLLKSLSDEKDECDVHVSMFMLYLVFITISPARWHLEASNGC